jgi:hypothetical protein
MRVLVFPLIGLLIACASDSSSMGAASESIERDPSAVRYVSADGYQISFSFRKMQMSVGPTTQSFIRLLQSGQEALTSSSPIRDCSDRYFACLASEHFVFAIPRGGVSSGMSYVAEGQRFFVKCQDSCQVADVRAVCERAVQCLPGTTDSVHPNARLLFTFDAAVGVVSMELGPGATGKLERRSTLVGGRGILAPQ